MMYANIMNLTLSPQFRNHKIVYRRYAGLFFCVCVDANDNELAYLEAIHLFVEVLGKVLNPQVCLNIPLIDDQIPSSTTSASWIWSSTSTRYESPSLVWPVQVLTLC